MLGRGGGLQAVPDDSMCAHDELRPRVPLVVSDVVVSLDPDPLLALGEEPIVAGLALPVLHYYKDRQTNLSDQMFMFIACKCGPLQNPFRLKTVNNNTFYSRAQQQHFFNKKNKDK